MLIENKEYREYKATAYIFSAIFQNKEQKLILGVIYNTVIKSMINELEQVESLEVVSKKDNEAILILYADNYVVNVFDFLPMKNEISDDKINSSIYYYLESYKDENEIDNLINDFINHCEKMKMLINENKEKITNFGNLNSVRTSILANFIYNENRFDLIKKNDIISICSLYKKKNK